MSACLIPQLRFAVRVTLAVLAVAAALSTPANAEITVSGQLSIPYDGSDPWVPDGNLHISFALPAEMTVDAGSSVLGINGFIGSGLDGDGVVLITGTDGVDPSTWTNSGNLEVAREGVGMLTIADGAFVENALGFIASFATGDGTVIVTGDGSHWSNTILAIGYLGLGTMEVRDGGLVSNTDGFVGRIGDANGTVVVTGEGARWQNSLSLYIAGDFSQDGGEGYVEVGDGGLITVGDTLRLWPDAEVHQMAGGRLVVSSGGGPLPVDEGLYIGNGTGTGEVEIDDGGSLFSTTAVLGRTTGSTGIVSVMGNGSLFEIAGDLQIGSDGNGTLNVLDGGMVDAGNIFVHDTRGTLNWAAGTIRIRGGTIAGLHHENDDIAIGSAGGQTLQLLDGATLDNVDGSVGSAASTSGAVLIEGDGSSWTNDGSLTIGDDGTGELTISAGGLVHVGTDLAIGTLGTILLDGGTLRFDGYTNDGTFDFQAGTIQLAGDRHVGTDATIEDLFGELPVIASGKALVVEGSTTVETVLAVDVGSFTTHADLTIGGEEVGELTIVGGGSVYVAGNFAVAAEGSVTLDGGTLRFDGYQRSGTIDYQAGTIQLAGDRHVGTDAAIEDLFGSMPTVEGGKALVVEGSATVEAMLTVDGGSVTTQADLTVGDEAAGQLTITSGGSVSAAGAVIASEAGSNGAVALTGAGATFTIGGDLLLGDGGTALVTIGGGGLVDVAGSTRLTGEDSAGQCTLILDGGTLRTERLVRGDGVVAIDWRSGTLEWTDAAGLTIDAGEFFGASLALNANQTLRVTGGLTVAAGAEMFASGGLASGGLSNHGEIVFSNMTVDGPVTNHESANITVVGEVTFHDLVDGPGGFFGPGTAVFEGGYSPGASPAIVPFEGSLRFGSGNTLHIELGGTELGEFDRLEIEGMATLDGALDVSLIDLGEGVFVPAEGDLFEIIAAMGGVSGVFVDPSLPLLPGGLMWNVLYETNSVLLEVAAIPVITGDFNTDGIVDAADYTFWRDRLGAGTTPEQFGDWKDNFGATAGAGATLAGGSASFASAFSIAPVPEPSSAWLLLTAAALLYSNRRCGSAHRRGNS